MKKYCIICAHPDDETLFFSSIMDSFNKECIVHCLTDGNADGRGQERKEEFIKAVSYFGVTDFKWSALADVYEKSLDSEHLKTEVAQTLSLLEKDALIFTHGPFGDYGHPHHIQVSKIVHELALNSDFTIYHPNVLDLESGKKSFQKDEQTWSKKLHILESVYYEEYRRFVSLIPARANESFIQSDQGTLNILKFFEANNNEEVLKGDLGQLGPYKKSLEIFKKNGLSRKF